jgi:GT2 family glycosyltransferase
MSARVTVGLSLLSWNTRDITVEALAALAAEAERLARRGAASFLVACDNGSTDGTGEALAAAARRLAVPCRLLLNAENQGISLARNRVIGVMLAEGADYLLLTDGDIEVVPGSVAAMLEHLAMSEPEVGCIGADSYSHTRDRMATTPYLPSLAECRIADDREELWAARTLYGLFRRTVFAAGVRFDESPPFDRPGWGCEDVDLAFQMHAKGFYIETFAGVTYLHRNVNSSIPHLRELGLDPRSDYDRRRRYVIEKWQGTALGSKTLDFLRSAEAEARF